MYQILRPLLFRMETERAHALTLNLLRVAGNTPPMRWLLSQVYKAPVKPVDAFGLTFKNPVGLAAGYDKDGRAIRGLAALGFGHIEIGTVTPRPQPGNPSPRVFRLVDDEAVINRLGFPSRGSEFVQMQLNPSLQISLVERIVGFARRKHVFTVRAAKHGGMPVRDGKKITSSILGVNLGRNKDTPNEEAVLDYLALLQNFVQYADYITINISSPNTAGLRDLQARDALESLLTHLHQQRLLEQKGLQRRVPILVKLAPDLTESQLDDAIDSILRTGMDGIIVTNTTLSRDGLRSVHRRESGGLSGKPLRARSETVLHQTVKRANGALPIVSAGGIMNPEDAKRRLEMGAVLVQFYTAMIYRGPGLVKEIVKSL
jgi:dihydroorotate dehydrogenase